MAAIKSIAPKSSRGSLNVDPTELTGADTLVYDRTTWQTLYIRNESVGAVTITLDGDAVDEKPAERFDNMGGVVFSSGRGAGVEKDKVVGRCRLGHGGADHPHVCRGDGGGDRRWRHLV